MHSGSFKSDSTSSDITTSHIAIKMEFQYHITKYFSTSIKVKAKAFLKIISSLKAHRPFKNIDFILPQNCTFSGFTALHSTMDRQTLPSSELSV